LTRTNTKKDIAHVPAALNSLNLTNR